MSRRERTDPPAGQARGVGRVNPEELTRRLRQLYILPSVADRSSSPPSIASNRMPPFLSQSSPSRLRETLETI